MRTTLAVKRNLLRLCMTVLAVFDMRQLRFGYVCLLVLTLLSSYLVIQPAQAVMTTMNNDTYWKDAVGKTMKAQGGNIIKDGNYYYLVGMDFKNGPAEGYFGYNGMYIYRSTDLVQWEYRNSIFHPGIAGYPSDMSVSSAWVGRPSIVYNSTSRKYVLIFDT